MGYLIEGLYVLFVVALSFALHRYLGVNSATTRKLAHILIGFVFVIQYHYFSKDALGLLLLPSIITVGLFLVARFRLVESMVNPENPYGIFYYALAITLSNAVACFYPPYLGAAGTAIFCLSFGDGFAALLAGAFPKRHRLYGAKSIEGSLICFFFSVAGMVILGLFFPALMLSPLVLFGAAALATVLELFTGRFDNPAIVFGVGIFVVLLG